MKNRPKMLSATFVRNVHLPRSLRRRARRPRPEPARQARLARRLLQVLVAERAPRRQAHQHRPRRYPVVTPAMARERALENARAIAEGRDPRRHRLPLAHRPHTAPSLHGQAAARAGDRRRAAWVPLLVPGLGGGPTRGFASGSCVEGSRQCPLSCSATPELRGWLTDQEHRPATCSATAKAAVERVRVRCGPTRCLGPRRMETLRESLSRTQYPPHPNRRNQPKPLSRHRGRCEPD